MLTARALSPVSQIAGLVLRWEQTKLSFNALNKIMAAPTDEAAASLQAPPLSGMLEFRDMSFGYPKQPPTIERLNLRIRPGERVGIIGKLGSGKSTLLKLILNQYAPATGAVLVDDIMSTQLEPLSLRRQIGYVPQDVTLFHGTMRENIEMGRVQADDDTLLAAIEIHASTRSSPSCRKAWPRPWANAANVFPGGQRQLVAIARALLMRPPLLLLDEPSSMVDPATEQKLISRLRALPRTTVVLVTHRMAMLALIDRLVVMDRGRVVADGPRDEVLKALAQRTKSSEAKPVAPEAPTHELRVAT